MKPGSGRTFWTLTTRQADRKATGSGQAVKGGRRWIWRAPGWTVPEQIDRQRRADLKIVARGKREFLKGSKDTALILLAGCVRSVSQERQTVHINSVNPA